MKSVSDLFRQQVQYNAGKSPYIEDFKGSPYSYLKARYYMFFASVLVYFLQNRSIHPITITKIYVFSGFLGAILLATPIIEAHFLAIFLIFSKGIFDWADGQLARLNGKTSLTGHVLDIYGAIIHSVTFTIGLGIYQYYYFDFNELFLMALWIYPFCYGTLLTKFSNQYILDAISAKSLKEHVGASKTASSVKASYPVIFNFLNSLLDDRSRTIDLVLLIILIEHFGGPALSWMFFAGVNLKWLALWCGSFIFSSRIGAADKVLASKLSELKDV
jgi:phosphatidylserine synthase